MSREGLLPRALGEVRRAHRVPRRRAAGRRPVRHPRWRLRRSPAYAGRHPRLLRLDRDLRVHRRLPRRLARGRRLPATARPAQAGAPGPVAARRRRRWAAVLYYSVHPVPDYPYNIFPYVFLGAARAGHDRVLRPALAPPEVAAAVGTLSEGLHTDGDQPPHERLRVDDEHGPRRDRAARRRRPPRAHPMRRDRRMIFARARGAACGTPRATSTSTPCRARTAPAMVGHSPPARDRGGRASSHHAVVALPQHGEPAAIEFARRIGATAPAGPSKTYLCPGGGEAVEAAMKLAMRHHRAARGHLAARRLPRHGVRRRSGCGGLPAGARVAPGRHALAHVPAGARRRPLPPDGRARRTTGEPAARGARGGDRRRHVQQRGRGHPRARPGARAATSSSRPSTCRRCAHLPRARHPADRRRGADRPRAAAATMWAATSTASQPGHRHDRQGVRRRLPVRRGASRPPT